MKTYSIENEYLSLSVVEFGARIHQLTYKDSYGSQELVHSLHKPEMYRDDTTCLNAVVGRFAGRICSESISIDGIDYPIKTNKGVHLHGGEGFSTKDWKLESISSGANPSIRLSYLSEHLDNGYPGTLNVSVTYTLNKSTLEVEMNAETDQTTLVNLTHHAYFRLDDLKELNQLAFKIPSPSILECKDNLCPTGALIDLKEHPFNFNQQKPLGSLRLDTPYVIDHSRPIEVYSPLTKMKLKVRSNQNCAVIYTPNSGIGFCIETQNYPNSPNCENFPAAELKKGELYKNLTQFEFSRE